MTLDTVLLLLGVFSVILPSLGFPNSIDETIIRLVGIAILIVGVLLRRRGGAAVHVSHGAVAESRPVAASTPRDRVHDDAVL